MGAPAVRTPEGHWPKGVSGNPSGKHKAILELEQALFAKFSPKVEEVMTRLYQIVIDGSEKVAPAAAKLFMDRILGGVPVPKAQGEAEDTSKLSDPEFWRRVLEAPEVRQTVLTILKGGKE